ncbi:MBL fold metallo-hydrolase RNA specificity domain-containing protein [Streptomyces sp. GQFP]|uniref:MBL fold metallo-hydrolase RNA specificity domain-containing protein n=1 Tax=Streptomyces sp. GQFP TaxID=2907545 RepID=UPI001F1DFA64|nr:MBL fold metallo-hydrolase RNA specificity domain-containing protein [Streptomyces sp. GQFP]UIX34171.1 hypothetical protein LUX31_31530 [Streptomyces sp. GQFP]
MGSRSLGRAVARQGGKDATRFSRILIARCTAAGRFSAPPSGPSRHLQHTTGAARPTGPTGPDSRGDRRHDNSGSTPDEYVPVRATVADVPHFSAHADAAQIIEWLRGAPAPTTTYLVHGEPDAAAALRDRVDRTLGWTAVVPRSGEHVLVR